MKPTPRISQNPNGRRAFPVTDYNYRPEQKGTFSSATETPTAKLPAIYKLSGNFGAELARQHAVEFIAFAVIIAICAVPLLASIIAAYRMVRGY